MSPEIDKAAGKAAKVEMQNLRLQDYSLNHPEIKEVLARYKTKWIALEVILSIVHRETGCLGFAELVVTVLNGQILRRGGMSCFK